MDQGIYCPIHVPVEACGGDLLCCQAYKLTFSKENTPQKPSNTYMNMLLHGALEAGLPKSYIEKLKAVETNGQNVHMPFYWLIYSSALSDRNKFKISVTASPMFLLRLLKLFY